MFTEKFSRALIWIGLIFIFAGLFFFLYFQPIFIKHLPINSEKFGQFGDLIGGLIGSIWALAGVILFYIALKEQRQDFKTNQAALETQIQAFKQQIKEFELQRQELEDTREVFKEQSKTQQLQQFESTFFNMTRYHKSIISDVSYFESLNIKLKAHFDHYEREIKNKNAIGLIQNLPKELHMTKQRLIEIQKEFDKDGNDIIISKLSYKAIFFTYHKVLGHYFRHLYHILKFIEKNDKMKGLNSIDYSVYADIFQAMLSSYELALLYYNMLFFPNLVDLVKKYNFIQNLSEEDLIRLHHKEYYNIDITSRLERFKI